MKFKKIATLFGFLAFSALAAEWKPAAGPLTTPWTSKVTAEHALPEYPRPQMVRSQWTNLNGLWDYSIVPKADSRPPKADGQILVPFPVESALSGVKRPLTPDQRLWYRRAFTAPNLHGKRLLLHFGAVDWRAEVFVNGKPAGTHEGGYDPFTFDITDALNAKGGQELVVAVWDPTDTGLQPRGKQVLDPQGIFYAAVSGIWQTVWLEPVPATHIDDLAMVPDIDGRKLRLTVHGEGAAKFKAVAKLNGRTVGEVSGNVNQESALPLSELTLWSPDHPALYDLEVTMRGGDSVKSYFGMRKSEVRKDANGIDRLFLNNAALFEIGPLDQGWWPDGLYTAPTDDALRFDIETMKKMGYNMCRKHVKVEPARWYYWCDKLGLMVWQDMPSAMGNDRKTGVKRGAADDVTFSPEEDKQFRRELDAMIHNRANAPSIVAWVPFNEGWGQHDTDDILKHVKALDPSRVVDGPSGWEDRGYGDMKDMHHYPGPEMYPPMPDRATVLGEFGGLGLPVEDHLWWNKRNWGYRTFEDRAKLQATYDEFMEQLKPLIEKGLSAAIYTQTTDVEGEVNGLMTYDRKFVKFDVDKLAEAHRQLGQVGELKKAAGR